LFKFDEKPEVIGHHNLKNKVGTIKYNKIINKNVISNEKSIKNVKNKISAIKNKEPGKPKNINKLIKINKKSFVFKSPIELISVINLVL
jgi:hypothetical protein